jgi:hypothetical protein
MITNLERQWEADLLPEKDEAISQLREKEIVPILSKVESLETAISALEVVVKEIKEQKLANESDLEVDPTPTSDLEEKIREYIGKHQGKAMLASNLFKRLGLTGKTEARKTAKKILVALGCVEIKVEMSDGTTNTKWQFP